MTSTLTALLVEDNPGDRRLIALALARQAPELEIHIAEDGERALRFLHREAEFEHRPRPDFVLLDLQLPYKSGLDVLREIKRDPELRRMPVIILTSSSAEADVASAYEHQASAYVAKPVADFDEVAAHIISFMRCIELPPRVEPRRAPPAEASHARLERVANQELAAIVRTAADAILSFDIDGTIRTWNLGAETLYGYSASEAIGRPLRLVVPDSRVSELERVLETVRRGGTERLDTVRVDRHGKTYAVSLTVSPIHGDSGAVIGASAIARDITERKAAEDRFRIAVESAPSGMVMVDSDGRILLANTEAEQMFGYARGELIGKPIELLVPARFAADHPSHRAAFRAQPEARAMGKGRELYAVRKTGDEFPVEIGLNPIHTPNGVVVLSAIVDITERKQAEERFRLAVDSSPNGMVMVDAGGTIVLVNAETERMFGYDRQELVGRSIDLLVPPRFRGQHPLHRDAFMSEPARREMGAGRDLYACRKDGTEFPVEIGLNPIETSEGTFVLSAIVDITERKQAEGELARQTRELARSNQELERFAYVASHDLQEPLRMVASFTKLLREEYADQLDDTAREYIGFAVDGAVRMQHLIRDLLAYARLSTGRREAVHKSLGEIVEAALGNLRIAIEESGAEIAVGDLPSLPVVEAQMVELFQNLIGNALKFRGEDPPRVTITARSTAEGWLITVADNGIGIAPEHLEAAFDVFRRLHARDEYPGTGIGLAICKRVVEQHGGRIWIDSELGQGALVKLVLPARRP